MTGDIPVCGDFAGHYRKAVKIAVWRNSATIRYSRNETLAHLLDRLVDDQTMHAKYPHLTGVEQVKSTDSAATKRRIEKLRERVQPTRLTEEQENVDINGWIWYVRHEDDNDYHVIVGSSPRATAKFMNVEISGLPGPRAKDRAMLERVCQRFQRLVGEPIPKSKYKALLPRMKVRIKGSLFWDADHYPPGKVGPPDARSSTVWEIHPVTSITTI